MHEHYGKKPIDLQNPLLEISTSMRLTTAVLHIAILAVGNLESDRLATSLELAL